MHLSHAVFRGDVAIFCAAHVHPHGGLVVVILFSLFAVHVSHAALRQPVPQVSGLLVPSDGLLDVRRHGENSCMGYSENNPRNPSQTFGFFSSARALDSSGFLSVVTGADDSCLFSIFISTQESSCGITGPNGLLRFIPGPSTNRGVGQLATSRTIVCPIWASMTMSRRCFSAL